MTHQDLVRKLNQAAQDREMAELEHHAAPLFWMVGFIVIFVLVAL